MNSLFVLLYLLFFLFLSAESKIQNSTENKNPTKIKTGILFLKNKNIQITLPTKSGYRKDLYDKDGNLLVSQFIDLNGQEIEDEPKIAVEKRFYNNFGFIESIQTFDKEKQISSETIFSYDKKCLELKKNSECVAEIVFYDGNKNPIDDENGIHKYKTEFDSKCLSNLNRKPSDCKILEKNLNRKQKLVEDDNHFAKVIRTFDDHGNLNLLEIYNAKNKIKQKAIYSYDYKCIEITNKPQGCIIFHEYLNETEEKEKNTNYGKRVIAYDQNCLREKKNAEKCISLEENYDLNGKLKDIAHRFTFGCMDYSIELGAYAKKLSKFDQKGNEIQREFYNSKNQLIEDSTGGAKYIFAYNQECVDQGNKPQYCRTLTEVYDKNSKLKYKAIYDENCVKTGKANYELSNYCIAWKEIYEQNKATENNNIKILKANFDNNGFKTNLEHYSINQKLSLKTIYHFDKEKLLKKENQDVNGKPREDEEGIATYVYIYEKGKYTTREETFGKDGKLKANSFGIAKMVFNYDENCLAKKLNRYECTTLEEFFDVNQNLVEPKGDSEDNRGYAKMIREFDKDGRLTLEAYYDQNHKLKKNKKGVSKYKFQYNTNGDVVLEEHYGKKNSLKERILFEYDSNCKSIATDFSCNTSIAYFNKKNQLIDRQALDEVLYAKETTEYNNECLKVSSEPDDCLDKKEFTNSKNEIIYAEYFKYFKLENSEIKLIRLQLSQDKIPYAAEFIK